ncbi:MAG TPA: hypothetical protein VIV11_21445 [Kofleriaceae bacterium]
MIRLCALALVLSGCKADLPKLTDANEPLDVRCTSPHADTLIDFFPTSLANTSSALAAPDGSSVVLAKDNSVTLGFIGLGGVTDAPGNDVRAHAMVDANATALAHVAGTDMAFVYAGTLTPAVSEIDIAVADKNPAIYVRIIAVGGTVRIDALEAIHDTCP